MISGVSQEAPSKKSSLRSLVEKQLNYSDMTPMNRYEIGNYVYFGFSDTKLRPKYWCVFLKYYSQNKFRSEQFIKSQRKRYDEIYRNAKEKREIRKEIERDFEMLLSEKLVIKYDKIPVPVKIDKIEKDDAKIMKNILLAYTSDSPENIFRIEMVFLLYPIYKVLKSGPSDHIEGDSFKMFSALMKSLTDYFTVNENKFFPEKIEESKRETSMSRLFRRVADFGSRTNFTDLKTLTESDDSTFEAPEYTVMIEKGLQVAEKLFDPAESDTYSFYKSEVFSQSTKLYNQDQKEFEVTQERHFKSLWSIQGTVAEALNIIKSLDYSLYEALITKSINIGDYITKWITTLFSTEFSLESVIWLWDKFLSDSYRFEIAIYCCVAAVCLSRNIILQEDAAMCHKVLQKLSILDVEVLFDVADMMRRGKYDVEIIKSSHFSTE